MGSRFYTEFFQPSTILCHNCGAARQRGEQWGSARILLLQRQQKISVQGGDWPLSPHWECYISTHCSPFGFGMYGTAEEEFREQAIHGLWGFGFFLFPFRKKNQLALVILCP